MHFRFEDPGVNWGGLGAVIGFYAVILGIGKMTITDSCSYT